VDEPGQFPFDQLLPRKTVRAIALTDPVHSIPKCVSPIPVHGDLWAILEYSHSPDFEDAMRLPSSAAVRAAGIFRIGSVLLGASEARARARNAPAPIAATARATKSRKQAWRIVSIMGTAWERKSGAPFIEADLIIGPPLQKNCRLGQGKVLLCL